MSNGKNHIIKTVCFDTQVGDELTAVAVADKLSAIDCESLLNNVFNKYDGIDETIRFDRIELDIGIIDLDEMNKIGGEILKQLEEKLDRLLEGKQNLIPLTMNTKIAAEKGSSPKIKSIEADIELLIHYLKRGSLPWNRTDMPDMEELMLNILHTDAAKLRTALVPELGSNVVIKRISTVFRYSTIIVLLKKLLNEDIFRQTETFSALVIEQIPASQKRNVEKELAVICLSCFNNFYDQNQNFIIAFIARVRPLLYRFSAPTLKTKERSDKGSADRDLKALLSPQSEGELMKSGKQDRILKDEKTGKTENTEKSDGDLEENVEQEYFFLDNAGLILLNWALIQQSLEQLGWVKERLIVNDHSRNKILIWMDYLVWGQRRIHEYGLMLNKVLVGMHPADVADIHVSLTGNEKKAANELLNTVIAHWSILKSTSIEGLRTTFLQRNGRLKNEDGGWQMHVESKGVDILIDSLPWTYTIIKSPWMGKPLFTEWSTKV